MFYKELAAFLYLSGFSDLTKIRALSSPFSRPRTPSKPRAWVSFLKKPGVGWGQRPLSLDPVTFRPH